MSIVDDLVVGPPFWDDGLWPQTKLRIDGTTTHHCDICTKKRYESCTLNCQSVRSGIKDGVEVTLPDE